MKVYVLELSEYSDRWVAGVFSSVSKAKEFYFKNASVDNEGNVDYSWQHPGLKIEEIDNPSKSDVFDDSKYLGSHDLDWTVDAPNSYDAKLKK